MLKKIVFPLLITATFITVTFLLFENLELYFTTLLKNTSNNSLSYAIISILVLASDIVLPVPSSIFMYTNGYVLGTGLGASISLVSLLLGSMVGYYIGRFTSNGAKSANDPGAQSVLAKYGTLSILITRGIPVISESICIVCGYNRMPVRSYLLLNFIGYLPLCILYAFCGQVGYDKDTFLLSFGCSLLISAAFWFLGKKYLVHSPKTNQTGGTQ